MNADGSVPTRLTENGRVDDDPAWSPDGTKIAFWRDGGESFDIYVMNADGSGETNLTATLAESAVRPSWSPDGTKIAFHAADSGIWTMNADGSNAVELTTNGFSPDWSPDGTQLVYVGNNPPPVGQQGPVRDPCRWG